MNSRSADAYLGLAMAEGKCRNRSELHDLYVFSNSKCIKNKSLFRAKQFGSEELKRWFKSLDTEVEEYQLAKAKAEKEAAEKAEKARLAKEEAERKALEEKKNALSLVRKKILPARQRIATGEQCTLGLRSDGIVIAAKADWARPGGYPIYRGEFETNDWKEIIAIAAGHEYTVGLKENGTVVAVGGNDEGQCNVNQWTDIVAITTGLYHTVGLKADGTVVAVGKNDDGQCNVHNWTDITSVYAGLSYTLGIKSDGTLIATGCYDDNIKLAVAEWRDIVAVAYPSSLFGLKSDGTVIYAGYDNKYNYYFSDVISKWHDIVAISGNRWHLVALRADGKVFAVETSYAMNDYGRCHVSEWSNVVAIATGIVHTVGLKADGTVVAVGSNNLNQCNVSGWKLFDNYETIEDDRKASIEKAKAERKAKREARVQVLNKEQSALQDELANLRGIFSGKRRREIEARLAEIGAELKKLQ